MTNLEKALRQLPRVEPKSKFRRDAKARLMHQIRIHENETWFLRILKKISPVSPPVHFMQSARMRLMAHVTTAKQPFFGWLTVAKKVTASVLVMAIAVTTTLLFTGGKQPVVASDNTYVQIVSGEVKIKHADKLAWDVITKHTELTTGDLIQLSDSASAIIHFFDDSELRLSGNSLLLLSRLDISPGFAKQGVIETSLHKGRAWVQTLNVNDDHAKFTIITPDAIVSTVNASFDVESNLTDPTTIRVFRHNVDVSALIKETRKVLVKGKLNSFQKISLDSSRINKPVDKLASVAHITELTDLERKEGWVMNNIHSDKIHLTSLRERELKNLRAATGSLPGDMFYPVKRAKERLSLAFRFSEQSQKNGQINMANQRLNESIVLMQNGEKEKARVALTEYQNIVHHIAEADKNNKESRAKLTKRVVATHQKTLIASLPGDSKINIVKEVLDETEELLEEDPIRKANIRLKNSLGNLVTIQDYVESGNLLDAHAKLKEHTILASSLIKEVTQFKSDEEKKKFYNFVLDAQHEERRILSEINKNLADKSADNKLVLLIKETDANLNNGIQLAAAAVKPLLPDVNLNKAVVLPVDKKVTAFVDKVNIYTSFTGRKNQINRLFDEYPQYTANMEFLAKLGSKLDDRTKNLIDIKILELRRKQAIDKGKEVRRKIEHVKSLKFD